jgi:hypothetical protein
MRGPTRLLRGPGATAQLSDVQMEKKIVTETEKEKMIS